MNQQVPKEVMDSISNEVKAYGDKYTTGSMLAMGIHGYSLAAEELARCRELLDRCRPYIHDLNADNYNEREVGIFKDEELESLAEALSSLPGKQEGEIEGQDELWNEIVAKVAAYDIAKSTKPDDSNSIIKWKKRVIDYLKQRFIIHLKTK